jgi:hypothetical protein
MGKSEFVQQGYALAGEAKFPVPFAEFDTLLARGDGSSRIPADHELVHALLSNPSILGLVAAFLGHRFRPVRAIAFDKTAGRNWAVPWHQDRTIAVDRRDERAGVRCWTVKDGVDHCEAPVALLESMLTLRWHLDAVGEADGCIRVLPGSHGMGRLTAEDISRLLAEIPALDVPVQAGAVFVTSPLLVHSSRKRVTNGRRRVLHVEFAAGDPPAPLRWACVPPQFSNFLTVAQPG